MAIPRFSFGSGASGLYNPNQVLVPTTLTSADRAQADKYQAESDAYNKAIEAYKQQAEEYNKALEAYNAGPRTSDFTKEVPKKPADLSFTQADLDAFEAASTARAQQLQAARQNALNIMQNPEGFSQQYGIGSLGFEGGGAVPQGGIANLNPYGIRYSGDTRNVISDSLKGKGYFGELPSPSGQAVTEYSLYDSDIGDYPSIVPTLTREEINDTVMRASRQLLPSETVVMKARRHAMERIAEGKSPFAGRTELRFPVPSETDQNMISRIERFLEKNRP